MSPIAAQLEQISSTEIILILIGSSFAPIQGMLCYRAIMIRYRSQTVAPVQLLPTQP